MEEEKEEHFGFSYDGRWFLNQTKSENYDKYCEKYQSFFHSINLTKIDKTIALETHIQKSKLEKIIIRNTPHSDLIHYFSKIKLMCEILTNKKILNFFLTIQENDKEHDNLKIITSLKKKDFDECKDHDKKLFFALEKEMKEILFREFVKK